MDFLHSPEQKPTETLRDEHLIFGFLLSPLASVAINHAKWHWQRERAREIDQAVSIKLKKDFEGVFAEMWESFNEHKWLLSWDSMDVWMRDRETSRDNKLRLITVQGAAKNELQEILPRRLLISGLIKDAKEKIEENPDRIPVFDNLDNGPSFRRFQKQLANQPETKAFAEYLNCVKAQVIIPVSNVNNEFIGVVYFHHKTPVKVTNSHEKWLLFLQFRIARIMELKELIEAEKELRLRLDNTGALKLAGDFNRGLVHELKNILHLMRQTKLL